MSDPIMDERPLAEEWLPSRFNLALFRALGLAVAAASRRRRSRAAILHHDREQHPLEAYALSCALLAVPSIHLLGAAGPRLPLPWLTVPLLVAALPFLATMAWDVIIFGIALAAFAAGRLTGLALKARPLQSPIIHALTIALSAASVALRWRTAWLGWTWLALAALNAACALALALAAQSVERFSREVGRGR
jgi:glucan phosphoethanolaminetransferase (alkaline phosphatase superfamily)